MQPKSFTSFPWKTLLDWYEKNGRHDLPWRHYSLPNISQSTIVYRVWLSEILLQQTQANRVIGFFNRMLERFPSIKDLAETDYETFFPYYQGLGYYSRARNILKTAKIIGNDYEGIFPQEQEKLIELPGIGPYTVAAIQSFGYGIPVLSWDTNLEKVFARYYNGAKENKLTKVEKAFIQKDLEEFLEKNMKKDLIRSINNALMDFAATVDLKSPMHIDWGNYPIKEGKFFEKKGILEKVELKKQENFPTPDATIIVILHKDHKIYYSSQFENENMLIGTSEGEGIAKTLKIAMHNGYSPFVLPPSLSRDIRAYVKLQFREKYNLELSVRPAHKKWLSENGKPYIAVHAQVQVGNIVFGKWDKKGEKL